MQPARSNKVTYLDAFFTQKSKDLQENFITFRDDAYQGNFTRSREEISKAVHGLGKNALILGSGSLNDMPLQVLAESFESIVLVDMSLTNSKVAILSLSVNLQSKFIFVKKDLTGYLPNFVTLLRTSAINSANYDDFINTVLDLLPSLKRDKIDLPHNSYNFVSCSLICSQLTANMVQMLNDLSLSKFDKPFTPPQARIKEFSSWLSSIEISFLQDVKAWTETTLYFSDHFTIQEFTRISIPTIGYSRDNHEQAQPQKFALNVNAFLASHFTLSSERNWNWRLLTSKKENPTEIYNGGCSIRANLVTENFINFHVTARILNIKVSEEPSAAAAASATT